jgi:hypothetical protein
MAPAVHVPRIMATRTAPEVDDGVPALERNQPASILFNVWMPILAGVLSVLLCAIVMLQE